MMRLALLSTLLLTAAAAAAEPVATAAVKPPEGKPVNGVAVSLAISSDRDGAGPRTMHPGEWLKFDTRIKVVSDKPMGMPWTIQEHVRLHITTPDGKHYVNNRGRFSLDPVGVSKWQDIAAGSSMATSQELRLSDGARYWFDPETQKNVSLELRKEGVYKMRAEFAVNADKGPANAWGGAAVSNEVTWTVSPLPVEKRPAEMTEQQKEWVDRWLKGEVNGAALLRIDMRLTESEALARRVMQELKNPARSHEALRLLNYRAGSFNPGDMGIDGPYLKDASEWGLQMLEKKQKDATDDTPMYMAVPAVLIHLHFHPEDAAIKDRIVALARQQCKVEGLTQETAKPGTVESAWEILVRTGILHDGMTLEEASEILGKPTRVAEKYVSWQVPSMSRRSYVLNAERVDGKLNWSKY